MVKTYEMIDRQDIIIYFEVLSFEIEPASSVKSDPQELKKSDEIS